MRGIAPPSACDTARRGFCPPHQKGPSATPAPKLSSHKKLNAFSPRTRANCLSFDCPPRIARQGLAISGHTRLSRHLAHIHERPKWHANLFHHGTAWMKRNAQQDVFNICDFRNLEQSWKNAPLFCPFGRAQGHRPYVSPVGSRRFVDSSVHSPTSQSTARCRGYWHRPDDSRSFLVYRRSSGLLFVYSTINRPISRLWASQYHRTPSCMVIPWTSSGACTRIT